MRVPVLHADTDPDNRGKHGTEQSSCPAIKAPSILRFHPGPQKGTMIFEAKLVYELSTGECEWNRNLYNVISLEQDYCTAIRQGNLAVRKNFPLKTWDVDEQVTYDEIAFTGHIFCYHDLPIPTDEEEVELLSRLKAYACTWINTTLQQYKAILAKVEKIPETPWRLSHS